MRLSLVSILVVLIVGCVMVDQTDAWFRRAVRSVGNWGRRKVVDPVGKWGRRKVVDPVGRWGRRIRVWKRTNGGDDGQCDLACFLDEYVDTFTDASEALATFNSIDGDGDGYVTQEEIDAYFANNSNTNDNTKRNLLSELEELKSALGDDDEEK